MRTKPITKGTDIFIAELKKRQKCLTDESQLHLFVLGEKAELVEENIYLEIIPFILI